MTQLEFKNKVKEMVKDINLESYALERANKMILSGCVNMSDFENDFRLPKCFLRALMQELAWQYKPHTKEDIKTSDNIFRCI